jgi:hypothetical protein
MIATAIITAPRGVPSIERSLASYRAVGFTNQVWVFAEPGSDCVILDNVYYQWNAERKGNFRNWVQALSQLLSLTDDEWLMVCEDDIVWAHGAADILEYDLSKFKRDGITGAISLFCPIRMSKVLEKQYANGGSLTYGWYGARIGRSTWGAQCLVFHRDWALQLLNDKVLLGFLGDPRWDKNVDALVAETINRKGREIVYRIPCLVDHTFGEGNSSLGYKPERPELKTKYFKVVQ